MSGNQFTMICGRAECRSRRVDEEDDRKKPYGLPGLKAAQDKILAKMKYTVLTMRQFKKDKQGNKTIQKALVPFQVIFNIHL